MEIFSQLIDWVGFYQWNSLQWVITCILIFILSLFPLHHGLFWTILRWPLLGVIYSGIIGELALYFSVRIFIRTLEAIFQTPRRKKLRTQLKDAKSYEEWVDIAKELDKDMGRDKWKDKLDASCYDWLFIFHLIVDLKRTRDAKDVFGSLQVLQQCVRGNVDGFISEDFFSVTNSGEPKSIILDFFNELEKSLRFVAQHPFDLSPPNKNIRFQNSQHLRSDSQPNDSSDEPNSTDESLPSASSTSFSLEKGKQFFGDGFALEALERSIKPNQSIDNQYYSSKDMENIVLEFFKRARVMYGETALCLSGGSMMGNYHWGVIKALFENNELPTIIAGCSAGAVLASMICTRTNEELQELLNPSLYKSMNCFDESFATIIWRFIRTGSFYSTDYWLNLLKWHTKGDMTFEEAFKSTGRVLNITVTAAGKKSPPVLLNHITTPNVVIRSAVLASASIPGFLPPTHLLVKDKDGTIRIQNKRERYVDGSLERDLPLIGLSETFNVNFFIASQTNPHIIPFFFNNQGEGGRPSRWGHPEKNRWRGGFLLSALESYLKIDMKAKLQFLASMNLLPRVFGQNWSKIFLQEFSGSVTMVPNAILIDYFKVVSNPNCNDMTRYLKEGQLITWRKLSIIKIRSRVARILDQCLETVIKKINEQTNCNSPNSPHNYQKSGGNPAIILTNSLTTPIRSLSKSLPN